MVKNIIHAAAAAKKNRLKSSHYYVQEEVSDEFLAHNVRPHAVVSLFISLPHISLK
jgi:hypothetical protein